MQVSRETKVTRGIKGKKFYSLKKLAAPYLLLGFETKASMVQNSVIPSS